MVSGRTAGGGYAGAGGSQARPFGCEVRGTHGRRQCILPYQEGNRTQVETGGCLGPMGCVERIDVHGRLHS